MILKNKKVLVYGLGDSGRAVIKILSEKGAKVNFFDDDIRYYEYVGFEREPLLKKYDFVVISPGVKVLGNEVLAGLRQKNIPILSELDFAYSFCKGKIVAITGTNGKTTTSMLVYRILKNAGKEAFLCGNIGLPFSSICQKTTKKSIVVCEVSNFQLETSQKFRPDVACILNIKPDHLDRHGSFEEYVKVKKLIVKNMKNSSPLFLNGDDEILQKLNLHKRQIYFSKQPLKKGAYVFGNDIFFGKRKIMNVEQIKMRGSKNLENVLASIGICGFLKISSEIEKNTVENFLPASHRMEIVGEIDGVTYVDDSKATNVDSAIACLEAFEKQSKIVLLGGKGKMAGYDTLFEGHPCIKKVVCFGEDGRNIFDCAKKHGYQTSLCQTFSEATNYAKNIAKKGDYVLLTPACSSFDEFSSYAERGDRFKEIVLGNKNDKTDK